MDLLRRHKLGPEQYTAKDRHNDFIRTFTQDPAGMRVLFQIYDWGGMYAAFGDANDMELRKREGRRDLCWMIMVALGAEVPIVEIQQEDFEDGGSDIR